MRAGGRDWIGSIARQKWRVWQGLWEMRTALPSKRIARVLFCLDEGSLVALHAFIKKTQKTPDDELALARQRPLKS